MYVAPADNEIMSTQKMWDMLDEYGEPFGESPLYVYGKGEGTVLKEE